MQGALCLALLSLLSSLDPIKSDCLVSIARLHRFLVHEAGILKHVCPFAAGACVAMLEMLAEVVGTVELLGRVAFPKLVNLLQVADAFVPVLVSRALWDDATAKSTSARRNACARKLVAAVAADVSLSRPVSRLMEGSVIA